MLDASLVALLGVVTVSDLRTRLVPDGPLVLGLLLALAIWRAFRTRSSCPRGSPRAAGAAGFLLAAALIRPDGMGLGDVKLAGVLGCLSRAPA